MAINGTLNFSVTVTDPTFVADVTYFGGLIAADTTGTTGQYEDGSYWVNGSVTEMYPVFETGVTRTLADGVTTVPDTDVNGFMLNPGNAAQYFTGDLSTLAAKQDVNHGGGVTSPDQAIDSYEGVSVNHDYLAANRPTLPITGGSIIKGRSFITNLDEDGQSCISHGAVITLVGTNPAVGAIRPPLSLASKDPILNVSDYDATKLRNLDVGLLANQPPSYAEALDYVTRIFDPQVGCFAVSSENIFALNGSPNGQSTYFGDMVATKLSQVKLALHTNAYTADQKRTLCIHLAVLAQDWAARVYEGGVFYANGGHCHERFETVAFCGEVFNNAWLRGAVTLTCQLTKVNFFFAGSSVWGALNQIYYITQEMIDGSAGLAFPYQQSFLGYPSWSSKHSVGRMDGGMSYQGHIMCNTTASTLDNNGNSIKTGYQWETGQVMAANSMALRLLVGHSLTVPQLYYDYSDRWIGMETRVNLDTQNFTQADTDGYIHLYNSGSAGTSDQTPAWVKDAYAQWSNLFSVWVPT